MLNPSYATVNGHPPRGIGTLELGYVIALLQLIKLFPHPALIVKLPVLLTREYDADTC